MGYADGFIAVFDSLAYLGSCTVCSHAAGYFVSPCGTQFEGESSGSS